MKVGRPLTPIFVVLCGPVLIVASCVFQPQSVDASFKQEALQDEHRVRLYERVAPGTVSLSVVHVSSHPLKMPSLIRTGTGFVVDKDGTVLTNAHVVEGGESIIAVLFDGQRMAADVLAVDPVYDIAILRLSGGAVSHGVKWVPVRYGNSDRLRVGQDVLVVGSPLGLGLTLTNGMISGLGLPSGMGGVESSRLIQTTAPINPGNSGGPLVDSNGHVIGMITASVPGAQNIGFAIPINVVMDVLKEFREKGMIERPWIGVTGRFLTEDIIGLFALPLTVGLLVEDIDKGSTAESSGLRSGSLMVTVEGSEWVLGGDIIVSIQGKPMSTVQAFVDLMRSVHVGQRVQIQYVRNGERRFTSAVLRNRPTGSVSAGTIPGSKVAGITTQSLDGRRRSPRVTY